MRRLPVAVVVGIVGAGLVGCGAVGTGARPDLRAPGGDTASGSAAPVPDNITVLAAASLTAPFSALATQFETAHPGVEVTLSFAGSSALATQITSGAPADVFASASAATMDAVVAAGEAADPTVFATNVMQIAVPPTNPGRVTGVASLARADVKTAVCQPQVPCGATAQQVFTKARIEVRPVTVEPDVKSVLSKVQLGEVDAGVVYVTDVLAAGDEVTGVRIPDDLNASTSYPIAALTRSDAAATATAFVDYVLSPAGAGVLAAAGFGQP